MPMARVNHSPIPTVSYGGSSNPGSDLKHVITYLQNLKRSNLQVDILKSENERLKRELAEVRGKIKN